MKTSAEGDMAETLARVLEGFEGTPTLRRLRLRVREIGANDHDELAQFHLLQRACREDPALAAAFEQAGLGAVAELHLGGAGRRMGDLVQAFNRMVEARWEER